jgi:hypothetical protein
VGKSRNPDARIAQHFKGDGAWWTKKHKPIAVEVVYPNMTSFDEDRITKEQMSVHGIDKVRGGTYVREVLTPEQYNFIQTEIRTALDRCTRCGHPGHFITDCPVKGSSPTIQAAIYCDCCDRCGRDTHTAIKCRSKTHTDGRRLIDPDSPPINAGKPWAASEERALIENFRRGISVQEIANRHGRTVLAIECRLDKLAEEGLIKSPSPASSPVISTPLPVAQMPRPPILIPSIKPISIGGDTPEQSKSFKKEAIQKPDPVTLSGMEDIELKEMPTPLTVELTIPEELFPLLPSCDETVTEEISSHCDRCGRDVHNTKSCGAMVDIEGNLLKTPIPSVTLWSEIAELLTELLFGQPFCHHCGIRHTQELCIVKANIPGTFIPGMFPL